MYLTIVNNRRDATVWVRPARAYTAVTVVNDFGLVDLNTGSVAKQAEHGGFAKDDINVMMLLSNPSFSARTVTSPVETARLLRRS